MLKPVWIILLGVVVTMLSAALISLLNYMVGIPVTASGYIELCGTAYSYALCGIIIAEMVNANRLQDDFINLQLQSNKTHREWCKCLTAVSNNHEADINRLQTGLTDLEMSISGNLAKLEEDIKTQKKRIDILERRDV